MMICFVECEVFDYILDRILGMAVISLLVFDYILMIRGVNVLGMAVISLLVIAT